MYLKKVEYEVDDLQIMIEELEEVSLDENDSEKKVMVGTLLTKKKKNEIIRFLRENKYVFA